MTSSTRRRVLATTAGLAVIGALAVFFALPGIVARIMNGVREEPPYDIDAAALELHGELVVADLHADTLLWQRDPVVRGSYGHVDLPRLRESGVRLQVFSTVTKTPRGLNFERNGADSDNITPLVIAQRWPVRTWTDLTERALYQAERLHRLERRHGEEFIVVESARDLARLRRAPAGRPIVGGLLAIEGMHALSGDPSRLGRLYAAGFRMMGLTHFFDNAIGGSAHGESKGGLTELGRSLVGEMERLGIIVDLAHASPALIDDVLAVAKRPVVVSHTGVKGTCDRTRNLSDAQLQSIRANGGLVGIAFFPEAVCGTDVGAISDAIVYTAGLIGSDHVALGSDFDGAVTTPFDVTGIPLLWSALSRAGMDADAIAAIAGGNVMRLLERSLPRQHGDAAGGTAGRSQRQ